MEYTLAAFYSIEVQWNKFPLILIPSGVSFFLLFIVSPIFYSIALPKWNRRILSRKNRFARQAFSVIWIRRCVTR